MTQRINLSIYLNIKQHSVKAYTTLVIGIYTNGLRTLLLHKEVFEVSQTITTVSL